MRFIFRLAFGLGVASNERPKPLMTAILKKCRHILAAVFSLLGSVFLVLSLGGCADVSYTDDGIRSPEARYNTYYAPDYYPYYPWYSYYGGAYYYGE